MKIIVIKERYSSTVMVPSILKKIIAETGLTILIVEQNVDMIMQVAAECAFMEKGAIVENCSVNDIRTDESIIACHMGV